MRGISSSAIQGTGCRPSPIRPPSPRRKTGSSRASAPPAGLSTMPKRRWTTRIPASRAGSAAVSHAWQTRDRKPSPGRLSFVDRLFRWAIAVVADGGGGDEQAGPPVQADQGQGQGFRAGHAAEKDLVLVPGAPAAAGDAGAGEVDHHVGALQPVRLDPAPARIPGDLARRGRGPRRAADQPLHSTAGSRTGSSRIRQEPIRPLAPEITIRMKTSGIFTAKAQRTRRQSER